MAKVTRRTKNQGSLFDANKSSTSKVVMKSSDADNPNANTVRNVRFKEVSQVKAVSDSEKRRGLSEDRRTAIKPGQGQGSDKKVITSRVSQTSSQNKNVNVANGNNKGPPVNQKQASARGGGTSKQSEVISDEPNYHAKIFHKSDHSTASGEMEKTKAQTHSTMNSSSASNSNQSKGQTQGQPAVTSGQGQGYSQVARQPASEGVKTVQATQGNTTAKTVANNVTGLPGKSNTAAAAAANSTVNENVNVGESFDDDDVSSSAATTPAPPLRPPVTMATAGSSVVKDGSVLGSGGDVSSDVNTDVTDSDSTDTAHEASLHRHLLNIDRQVPHVLPASLYPVPTC